MTHYDQAARYAALTRRFSVHLLMAVAVFTFAWGGRAAVHAQAVARSGGARFTLSDALQALEAGHPALAAARLQIDAAGGDAVAAGVWENPSLSVAQNHGVGANRTDTPTEFDWSVSQTVDIFRTRAVQRRSGEFERDATRADYEGVLATLRLGVERALAELGGANLQRTAADHALSRLESAMNIVRIRVEAGAEPRYDLHRMALSLADARADVEEARADARQARARFDVAVGPGAARLAGDPDYSLAVRDVPSLDDLVALASQRPDLVAARLRARSAAEAARAARRGLWPSLHVSVGESQVFSTPNDFALNFGFTFDRPFVNRGQGTLAAARARSLATEEAVRGIDVATRQTLGHYYDVMLVRRRASSEYGDTLRDTDETLLREAEAAYQGGLIEILDLVDAYSSYSDARAREIDLSLAAREAELDTVEAATVPGTQAGGNGG